MNCIAIDDEPLAIDVIKRYCDKIPFLNLLYTTNTPFEALEYLKHNAVDLMFLDIEMEDLTGIQFINVLQTKPMIILTTAYENYAIEGYGLEVDDYLLKPISFERFIKAVNKCYEKKHLLNKASNESGNQTVIQNKTAPLTGFIFLKVGFDIIKVPLSDIKYIEGQSDYLKVATTTKNHMTLQTFKELEAILPASYFIRIHKSYIVSIAAIDSIIRNRVWIGDTSLPIGSTYKSHLFSFLKENKLLP